MNPREYVGVVSECKAPPRWRRWHVEFRGSGMALGNVSYLRALREVVRETRRGNGPCRIYRPGR
jgi:hypothetical protein